MKNDKLIILMGTVIFLTAAQLFAARIYVDNVKGEDKNSGSLKHPLRTLKKALSLLKQSDELHLTKTGKPYRPSLAPRVGGAPGKPLVIDGHGATISGLTHFKKSDWKDEGGGVYSRKLPNNAWVMDRKGYWCAFPIVFFDTKPASFVKSRESLKPYTYFLLKIRRKKGQRKYDPLHNTLYIKLPSGKDPDTVKVETIRSSASNVSITYGHTIVRNLISEYTGRDGFATTARGHRQGRRTTDIVFENIEARRCMDQGISNHGAEVVVKNGWFHHNAGCGAVDVYKIVRVRYENCIFENDTYRGGVELHSGRFELLNCIIRNNVGKALSISRGAEVKITNCLFIGLPGNKTSGIGVGGKTCKAVITNCTFWGFRAGFIARRTKDVTVKNCAILKCDTAYGGLHTAPSFTADFNILDVKNLIYVNRGRKKVSRTAWDNFTQKTGFGKNSALIKFAGTKAPTRPLTAKNRKGKKIKAGVRLSTDMREK